MAESGNRSSAGSSRRDDDYDWGARDAWWDEPRTPPPPPKPRTPPLAYAAVVLSSAAILLWFVTAGARLIFPNGFSAAPSSDGIDARWMSATSSRMANSMFPAVIRLRACLADDNASCACAVNLPEAGDLIDELHGDGDSLPSSFATARSTLDTALREYINLKAIQKSSCGSGGNVTSMEQAMDRYTTAHDRFVDEYRKAASQ